jgi:uncharacterized SAM-binding protein YcdF (DUF218 family)
MATPTMTRAQPRPPRPRAASARSRVVGFLVVMMMLGVLAALVAPVYAGWRVVTEGHADDRRATDAIVVLGAAQYNGRPSPVLRARLAHAKELYEQDVSPRIVTVGGMQPGDRYTEAGTGVKFLVERGVPATDISAIGTGNDTRRSLIAVARMAQREGWNSVTLVSDPAHMARADAIARRLGFRTSLSPTRTGDGTAMTTGYVARETAGLLAFEVLQRWETPRLLRG